MRIVLSLFLVFAAAVPAAAFHPLITEDVCFLGSDGRQIELGLDHAVEKSGPDRYATAASAELSYGLFDRFDVLVTVPWQGWSSQGLSKSGLGDVLVEAKFPAVRKAAWDFAVKTGFSLPAGDEADSLGAGKGGVWAYGIAGRTDGPRQYYFNAGYMFRNNSLDEQKHILKASAAGALEVLPKTIVSAELSLETAADNDSLSHPAYSLLGLTWTPYPTLDPSAGLRAGLTRAAADISFLGGLTLKL